jgi:hypothetical protein
MQPAPRPMLSNPPALVLLALIVGLGAYLRQVAENLAGLRDDIEENLHPRYPENSDRRHIKLTSIESSLRKVNGVVAPVMIVMAVLTAVRLTLQSFSSLGNSGPIIHPLEDLKCEYSLL